MPIKIGNISAKDIYIGSTPAKEIRLGSTLIWSRAQEEVYYTLTVNIEGNSEAYYDGYTIYVNESEFARIDHSDTFSIPSGATVRTHNNSFGINGYKHSESIVPLPSPSFSTGDSWVMDKDYSITVVAQEEVYYTLTIDASGAINANGDSIFDYAVGQYKAPNSSEWVQILDAGGDYHLDHGESVLIPAGSEISLGANRIDYSIPIYVSQTNFILSENTTVYITRGYTLTINLGEGVDYSDIWYKEPNATEWTEASKYTSLAAPAGTKFYIYTQPLGGYAIDSDINLGSQSNPLELNADITINITAHQVVIVEEEYEFNVEVNGVNLSMLEIKVGDDIKYHRESVNNNIYGTDTPIIHNGSQPISVEFSSSGSLGGYTWSGSFEPTWNASRNKFYWDSLYESGTLKLTISSS